RAEVLTPLELIRSATIVNAELLQMTGRLGIVAPGALAARRRLDGDRLRTREMLIESRSQWRSALVLSLSKDMPRDGIDAPLLGVLRQPHLDAGEALAMDAEEPRGLFGEIDRPAVAGAAVVDPDIDRAAILRVGHPQPGLERQPGMG